MFNISRLREHPRGPGVWKFLSNSYCAGMSRSILLNSCKTRIFRFKDQKGHSGFYKDSALSPFYLYSAKWGFQFYPLSTYILPNGVFSFVPFLYIFCQMGFSVLSPFSIYSVKWGFQFYPLSRYILSNGVFSFIPFLLLLSPFLRRRVDASSHGKKEAGVTISNVGNQI